MVPLIRTLSGYDAGTLRADLAAGLTVAVMLVPQSMAYAALAGLPPVAGLYASVVPLIVYALLGTSGSLAVGPVALVSLLTAATVAPLADGDVARYSALAAVLALMVGAIQITLGAIRAGRLVAFLSHGVLSGFTSAAAIVIAVSQVPALLGFTVENQDGFVGRLRVIGQAITDTHPTTALIGLGSIVALMTLRKRMSRLPGPLLVVAVATLAVWALGLAGAGVAVLGEIPRGLTLPAIPTVDADALLRLLPGAVTIAVIGYAEGIGIAKAIGVRSGERIVPNAELWAVGAANVAAGLFSAFPVAGGISRTAVNHEAGAKTSMASVVTAATVAVTVLLLTPLFTDLPKAVLSAVVVAAVVRLVDFQDAVRLFRFRPVDGLVLALTFLVTLFVSIEMGLVAGLTASIVVFVARSSTPHIAELGRVPGTDAYRNRLRYDVEIDPQVLIVRVDGPLFYASAQTVSDTITEHIQNRTELGGMVLDASAITDIDSDGMHTLHDLATDLMALELGFALATVRGPVRDLITRSSFADELAPRITPDIESAMALATDRTPEPI